MKEKIVGKVASIIKRVKKEGDRAVLFYTKKFDGVNLTKKNLAIEKDEIRSAYQKVNSEFLIAIKKAYANIQQFHRRQLLKIGERETKLRMPGSRQVDEKFVPINRVGIYVPGGRYSYPSTLLMAAIPARVAGVREIVLTTPGGNLTAEILVTADLCKIKKIYRVGGAQAIAALAYGTETISKVDKIVGPGNIYVTIAKKLLFGEVGIDMLAGPSEIMILADDTAKEKFILLDLLAQAEHDPQAGAILLTKENSLLRKIKVQIPKKFRKQIKLIKIANLSQGIEYVNLKAPEHLELLIRNPEKILHKIENSGAIFLGNYSPVAVGDYIAGPSHILPTDRTARFSSGLSVYDFLKRISIINYNREKLKKDLPYALTLAKTEGMKYHYQSLKVRRES